MRRKISIFIHLILLIFSFHNLFSKHLFSVLNKTESSMEILVNFENKSSNIIIFRFAGNKSESVNPLKDSLFLKDINIATLKDKKNIVIFQGESKFYSAKLVSLKPECPYFFDIYEIKTDSNKNKIVQFVATKQVYSLSVKPKIQADQIIFKDTKNDELELLWLNGDGKGRVIVVSKNQPVPYPKDGIKYLASNMFGKNDSQVDENSYVVYSGEGNQRKPASVKINGLADEKYYFQIFEYNGSGETISYLTEKGKSNPRAKAMPPEIPKNLKVTKSDSLHFLLGWSKSKRTEFYELDVARDSLFQDILNEYNSLNVGNELEFDINLPDEYDNVYCRLRAVSKDVRSLNSKTVQVIMKNYEKIEEKKGKN